MRRYSAISNNTNTVSTLLPLGTVVQTSNTVRGRLYEFEMGSDATPADAATKLAVWRTTTSGLGTTTVTPNAFDPGDPASLFLWYSAWTSTLPAITATSGVIQVPFNQRATFRWVAVPDSEIVMPATAWNGLALMSVVASATANYAWTFAWQE